METPEENLALDEALLDLVETSGGEGVLRFHEPAEWHVVVGFGNQVGREVAEAACRKSGVPVLRRSSGGGTVVLGPGCLAYAVVLPTASHPDLATVTGTNRWVMERHRTALQALLGQPVAVQGHTDLTLGDRKFGGNAQRRCRRTILFHGTFLLTVDLDRLGEWLPMPSWQPAYRRDRSHRDFLINLPVPAGQVKEALRECWGAREPWETPWAAAVDRWMRERYGRPEWHARR